jgi:solute carrier family 25 phosphate transporter 3
MKLPKRPLHVASALLLVSPCLAFQSGQPHSRRQESFVGSPSLSRWRMESDSPHLPLCMNKDDNSMNDFSRREMLASMAATAVFYPLAVQAVTDATEKSIEDVELGKGSWNTLGQSGKSRVNSQDIIVPSSFATYAARILISYDKGVASWWNGMKNTYSLLSEDEQKNKLGLGFGNFAASVQVSINTFVTEKAQSNGSGQAAWGELFTRFIEKYGKDSDAIRQICILFSLLPKNIQPTVQMQQFKTNMQTRSTSAQDPLSETLTTDYAALLPDIYGCSPTADDAAFKVVPAINLYEVGIDEEFGQAVTATVFGPLSSVTLTRDFPSYSPDIYALFGISGAAGCALTHSVVIPLDVVKTKAQTDPEDYANIFAGASRIVQNEGIQGLLTGAQATLAGYTYYGLSVYPSYTFFKRTIGQTLLPADFSLLHTNEIALVAGALSAVIASLGLTPLEAARIRVVADPEKYKPLGLLGTLDVIAKEDATSGLKALYAGLPSLMTRQVIFGSIKFLAFEQACDTIYVAWPFLRDATWTALTVSLVAGGFSGALSSVVSQPADAVLTYVAQRSDGKGSLGVIEGCQLMVEESGFGSLFRGLGSRSLWAASIIAGQFLLYDVFRNFFGVTIEDLTQVFDLQI